MGKVISIEEAVAKIPDGATVMFGGFMGCGNAHKLIDALAKSGKKDLTMICNDASMAGGPLGEDYYGVAKLVHNHQVKKLIATHVGLNPEVATQNMQEGTLEVILVPQGSMAEMIRAGGAGLGGVLTPTGVGTIIEESPLCLGTLISLLSQLTLSTHSAICGSRAIHVTSTQLWLPQLTQLSLSAKNWSSWAASTPTTS